MEAIKASNRSSRCVSLASPLLFQPATSWVLCLVVGCDINSLSHTLGPPWSERLCLPDHEDWSLWNHKPNGSSLKSLLSEASELGCSRAERLGMTAQSRVPGINLISAGCSVGQSYTVGSCYCRTRELIQENPGNGDSSGLNRTSPPSAAQGTLQTAGRVWGREIWSNVFQARQGCPLELTAVVSTCPRREGRVAPSPYPPPPGPTGS